MRRLGAWSIAAWVLVAGAPSRGAEPTGGVRGSIELLRRSALGGGISASDDRSGVVVYATGFTSPAPGGVVELRQHRQRFEPRLVVIVRGQTVTVPNDDRIYHTVFSVSPLATFDLGQYKGKDPPRTVTFDQLGLVPVYCNIHPQMLSYVAVLENDAFAITGKDGGFEIHGIPAGERTLNAWAPGAPRVSQTVRIEAGQVAELAFHVEQTERIEPHKRKDGSDYPKSAYKDE